LSLNFNLPFLESLQSSYFRNYYLIAE